VGIRVVKNENNELIAARTIMGWRMCVDYGKLNKATRKNHFPPPFIDPNVREFGKEFLFLLLRRLFRFFKKIPIHPSNKL